MKKTKIRNGANSDPTGSEFLAEAIRALQINNVFLKSCSSDCITGPGAIESGGITIATETTHTWSLSPDKKIFLCFVTMNLKGMKGEEPQFLVEACFALGYEVFFTEKLTDDMLGLFAKTNSVYNAYPYFREFFQNTMVRMGMPPFQLPLLKPQTNKKQLDSVRVSELAGA